MDIKYPVCFANDPGVELKLAGAPIYARCTFESSGESMTKPRVIIPVYDTVDKINKVLQCPPALAIKIFFATRKDENTTIKDWETLVRNEQRIRPQQISMKKRFRVFKTGKNQFIQFHVELVEKDED
jgi:hypothetical protein